MQLDKKTYASMCIILTKCVAQTKHTIPGRFAGRAIQNIELDGFRNDFSQPGPQTT